MKKIVKYRKRKQFHIGKFIGILFICMVGCSFFTTLKNEEYNVSKYDKFKNIKNADLLTDVFVGF